jgi:SecD/SecF fusion protein
MLRTVALLVLVILTAAALQWTATAGTGVLGAIPSSALTCVVLSVALALLVWLGIKAGLNAWRLSVTALIFVVAVWLLFLQNKVMVGEQELQAQIQLMEKPGPTAEKPEAKARTYKVAFTDLAGNGVFATANEREQVVQRLAGNARQDKIPAQVGEVTPDHVIEVTIDEKVVETTLKQRLQGSPFKRANEPRHLFNLNPGIDLRGGVEFICQLRNDDNLRVNADSEVMHVLRSRLDERGLSEPVVAKLSNGDVQVVIPGGTRADAARTRKVLEDTGRLEFREILQEWENVVLGKPDQPVVVRANGTYAFGPGIYHNRSDLVAAKRVEPGLVPDHFYRLGKAELTGKDVANADQTLQQGEKAVAITFNAAGAARNEAFTTRLYNTGQRHGNKSGTGRLAILFDGVVQSDPYVESPSAAHCQITGRFTNDEIDRLKTSLKAGSLSVTPEVLSERVVGATLGVETVSRSLVAMIASFVLIVAFMAWYYRTLGYVANLCLVVTALLIYATISVFGATVTLPGLAGLVLIIGMAVDTNILVFERIREELREDKGLMYAIEHGYDRAFLTIVDAHLTTFVTALVLYIIGSGPVKGFGLTLMIGIVVNLFSGIYVGRLLTDWMCRGKELVKMEAWVPALKLPYIEWRHYGYAFSIITGVLGALYFAFGHYINGRSFESNFDIDFTGGNMVQVIFKEPHTMSQVEAAIKAAHAAEPKTLDLLDPGDLRMQAYVANVGDDASRSRQWVFRGRDEEGSRLETERDAKEQERIDLQRQAEKLRNEATPQETEARKLQPRIDALALEVRDFQDRIAKRTDAFKEQIAKAFPGMVATEGDEVAAATWHDAVLSLTIATLDRPDPAQVDGLIRALSRRDELGAVVAKALTGDHPGIEITATYRQKPVPISSLDLSDPVQRRLQALFTLKEVAAPTDEIRGQIRTAYELFNAVALQAAKERVSVAKPFPSTEHFSGQVAGQMKLRALLAVLLSLAAIMAYVAARFEFRFGIGAVVSLFHDVILTTGIIAFLGIRIDLTVIAALLTIIGYSINDTVVTFDRIRENLKKHQWDLAETIDLSIAQTMSRTVLTTSTVVITVAVLLLFGGDALFAFNATLLIGLFFGTYSSIFVAAPLLMTFQKKGVLLIDSTPASTDEVMPPGLGGGDDGKA